MGGTTNSRKYLGLCGVVFLCVVVVTVVLCAVLVRPSQKGIPSTTNGSSINITSYSRGVQEDCNVPDYRGPRCIEANLTAGECYDLANGGFSCVGNNITYRNQLGAVYRETMQEFMEEEAPNWDSSLYNYSDRRDRDLVDFVPTTVGITFVDIQFKALQCRKTTMEWEHSTPRSSYLSSYTFYDICEDDGIVFGGSKDVDGVTVDYYENEYQDYSAFHRVMLLDLFDRDISRDRRGFGALMDVWPDTTDCYYEMIVSSGGVSTDQWDANIWKGIQDWSVSWPAGVAVERSGTTSYCEKHSASFYCSVPSPSGVQHKNTFAVIAPIY